MILKYGRILDNGAVEVILIDNIVRVEELEPQEIESERLTKFVRSVPDSLGQTYMKLDFVYDKRFQYGYLLNDQGDTIKVLKYDNRTNWHKK